MPSPLFGLLVCGWEEVEGMGSSSLSTSGCTAVRLGPSPWEGEASVLLWPLLGTRHEATRMGGWMDSLSPSALFMVSNHSQVAAVASVWSVPLPVGGFFNS